MKLRAAVLAGAPHLLPAVELLQHAVLPVLRSTHQAVRTRAVDESLATTTRRAARAATYPIALGVGFLGLHELLGRLAPNVKLLSGWLNGHDLSHIAGGALLGFASGVLESLKPELFGHGHHHPTTHAEESRAGHRHHDHGRSKARTALKHGLRHAAIHALLDGVLIAVSKGLVAAAGGTASELCGHTHGFVSRHRHGSHGHHA